MATRTGRIEVIASIVLLALLVIGCFVILRPFLAALAWALILAITTWPAYQWIEARFGGRRTLAALLMTTLLALAFLLPFAIAAPRLAQNVAALASEGRALLEEGPPEPPSWVAGLPVVGPHIAAYWQDSITDLDQFTDEIAAYVPAATGWLLGVLRSLGAGFL